MKTSDKILIIIAVFTMIASTFPLLFKSAVLGIVLALIWFSLSYSDRSLSSMFSKFKVMFIIALIVLTLVTKPSELAVLTVIAILITVAVNLKVNA